MSRITYGENRNDAQQGGFADQHPKLHIELKRVQTPDPIDPSNAARPCGSLDVTTSLATINCHTTAMH